MKVYNANEQYEKYKNNDISANLDVAEPIIDDKGFTVALHETASNGDDIRFDLFVKAKETEVSVDADRVAYILAALSLQKYGNIQFNFAIQQKTLADIERITCAVVKAKNLLSDASANKDVFDKTNVLLNVSGGIDSAAMAKLLPDCLSASLAFTTEGKGEELVDLQTAKILGSMAVQTNASEFLFPHYPWGYYNIGALLLAPALNAGAAADGAILGDTPESWTNGVNHAPQIGGVDVVFPMAGFSKLGIFKLLYQLDPDFYNELTARWFNYPLAGKTIKNSARFRWLLDYTLTGTLRDVETPMPRVSASGNVFYAAYLINKLGADMVGRYFNNLSEELTAVLQQQTTGFLEKYDQNALERLPDGFKAYVKGQLERAGISFYTEQDYADRENLAALLW